MKPLPNDRGSYETALSSGEKCLYQRDWFFITVFYWPHKNTIGIKEEQSPGWGENGGYIVLVEVLLQ